MYDNLITQSNKLHKDLKMMNTKDQSNILYQIFLRDKLLPKSI